MQSLNVIAELYYMMLQASATYGVVGDEQHWSRVIRRFRQLFR